MTQTCLSKACFKCGFEKPLDEFYVHPSTADGHLGKCKVCARLYGRLRRQNDPGAVREVERRTYKTHRTKHLERTKAYSRAHPEAHARALKRSRERYPEKFRARQAVANALRTGALVRQPCEICGTTAEAHHNDYKRPLDVQWLCPTHHRIVEGRVAA